MKLLAIDTATELTSVALWHQGTVWTRQSAERPSGAVLPLLLDEVLAMGQSDLAELDGFVVSRGPGSFTGVRIGVGFVQGLAYGLGRPVCGISTLRALASTIAADHVMVALDARKQELYWGAYARAEGQWRPVQDDQLTGPDDLAQWWATHPEPWVGVGNGFTAYPLAGVTVLTPPTSLAAALVTLAAREWPRGTTTALGLQPLYLRNRVVD